MELVNGVVVCDVFGCGWMWIVNDGYVLCNCVLNVLVSCVG